MDQIVVFPRGQLTPKDKERLTRAGVTAIEADDPSKVVVIIPSASVRSSDDHLMAALFAIECSHDASAGIFVKELRRRLRLREGDATPPAVPGDTQP